MASHRHPHNTIPARTWKRLQQRAEKANPHLASVTDPRAVAHRRRDARQHQRAREN